MYFTGPPPRPPSLLLLDGTPQVNKLDFCVFLASCFGCLFYSIEFGLGIAVGLAILTALYQVPGPQG